MQSIHSSHDKHKDFNNNNHAFTRQSYASATSLGRAPNKSSTARRLTEQLTSKQLETSSKTTGKQSNVSTACESSSSHFCAFSATKLNSSASNNSHIISNSNSTPTTAVCPLNTKPTSQELNNNNNYSKLRAMHAASNSSNFTQLNFRRKLNCDKHAASANRAKTHFGDFSLKLASFVVIVVAVVNASSCADAWLLGDIAAAAVSSASGASQATPNLQQQDKPAPLMSQQTSDKITSAVANAAVAAVSAAVSNAATGKQQDSIQASGTASGPAAASSTITPAKSIVASLSSSVASAAAAAVAAAAHNALMGGDSRKADNSHHAHSHPNPVSARQLKMSESMSPEVPYNILHNMKKLDHAAPFYNAPGQQRVFVGKAAETASNLIQAASGHKASGGSGPTQVQPAVFTGLQQLGSLFRSPILRRLAEGAGEFASEFRSFFRPLTNNALLPHKSPAAATGVSTASGSATGASSLTTTRLLRDISVPALLMLLVSAMPNEVSKTNF